MIAKKFIDNTKLAKKQTCICKVIEWWIEKMCKMN